MGYAPRVSNRGVVAAGDAVTAAAGAQLLRAGGNAVDAICAAAFASFVAEIPLTSPAGAGLLLFGSSDQGWRVLDFFARVPGLGGRPDPLDFFAVEVDFGGVTQEFHIGRGAAAVPGALRGLVAAHDRYGRLPLGEVVEPAQRRAREGVQLSPAVAGVLELLTPIMTLTPEVFALSSGPEGTLARGGDRVRNPGLEHLFDSLARDARQTLRAVDADLAGQFGPARGGLLTPDDLARFAPVERAPLRTSFRGATILTAPPSSAGGGLIALGLRIAERSGLLDVPFGEHWAHLAEVLGAVGQARLERYDDELKDPRFLARLLSDAAVDAAWHRWRSRRGRRPDRAGELGLGSTTHISVLDGDGDAASLTASNGEGCGHALTGWGVHVNNFLGEEDINPRGFHADPAGSPMTTMMAPTVVLRDQRPALVLGSGGSNRLRSAITQALLLHLGWERSLPESVAQDRLHVEGDKLWFEATDLDADRAQALEAAWPGASRFDAQSMFFGGVHAVAQVGGVLVGAGDPRRDGVVCSSDDV